MQTNENLSMIRLRRSTHVAINEEARALGLKQWAMIERIAGEYFTNKRGSLDHWFKSKILNYNHWEPPEDAANIPG